MTAHAKFMFETVFDNGGGKPMPELEFTQGDLDGAKEAAFQAGYQKGREEALAEASDGMNKRITDLQQNAQNLTGQLAAMRAELTTQAAGLALAAARTLAAALMSERPEAEMIALFEECIGQLKDTPHLAVRVSRDDIEEMRRRCEQIAAETGFNGNLIVLEEAEMGFGDCRIEWADGGVTRDIKQLYQTLAKIVVRHTGVELAKPASEELVEQAGLGATEPAGE